MVYLLDVNSESLGQYKNNPYTNTDRYMNKLFSPLSKDPRKLLRDAIESGKVHTLVQDGADEFIIEDYYIKFAHTTCIGYLIHNSFNQDE